MTTISETNLNTFGDRLRHTREEQGLSRPDLSRMTNRALTARVIDHLESGHTEASISRAELLAKVLKVDILWLIHGEGTKSPTGADESGQNNAPVGEPVEPEHDPDHAPEGTQETGNTGQTLTQKPVETGLDRSGPVQNAGDRRLKPTEAGERRGEPADDAEDEYEGDIKHMYVDEMYEHLELVDALRENGFLKHQRKMPHLLEHLETIAKYLEAEELKEIAFDREIELGSDEAIDIEELTSRVIDTAVLGTDLYDVDFDVLKAFARKHGVEQPLFSSWKHHDQLVPLARPAYREKSLSESLTKSTALALAG